VAIPVKVVRQDLRQIALFNGSQNASTPPYPKEKQCASDAIDFGLLLAARLSGDTYAKMLQLINEYDPQPPFHAGNVKQAGPILTEHLQAMLVRNDVAYLHTGIR